MRSVAGSVNVIRYAVHSVAGSVNGIRYAVHSVAGSQHMGPGSIPGQSMWDLWWTK